MYTSLNICQRFSRLISSSDEDDEIPAIKEEISYLFTNPDRGELLQKNKYITLKNKRFCYRNFNEISKVFYSMAMKMHRQAEDVLLADNLIPNLTEIADIHEFITQLLAIHRQIKMQRFIDGNSGNLQDFNFISYRNSFLRFTELPENALQKLTSGLINRQPDSAVKAYFHLMLDVLWLLLTIHVSVRDDAKNQEVVQKNEENLLQEEVITLMQEIHFVMLKCYEKSGKFHVFCPCLKVFYLRMQIFCEKKNLTFWELFNTSMSCYPEEFSLYMLKFQAGLQQYSEDGYLLKYDLTREDKGSRVVENLEFFNKNWSLLMKNSPDIEENKIAGVLSHLEELLSDLWLKNSKLEFYYLTWDFYCKRIEDVVEKRSLQQVFALNVNTSDRSVNGYLIFLRMLKRHLQSHPHHWNKFKGRIYTKFSPGRFQKLSEQGIHNLAILFFTLSGIGGNFTEISGKFLGLLKELPGTKQNLLCVWSVYIFMIKQHLDNNTQILPVYTIFNPLLEAASKNRTTFHLLTSFVSNFEQFYRVPDLTLKQSLFIGTWLDNYLKSCAHNDLVNLLNALSKIINHTVENGVWYEYQPSFVGNVLAPLKRLQVNSSLVGTVAGLIVAHSEGLDDVVEYFITENVPGEVMLAFFMTLARKSTFTTNEKRELLTLKAWFLCEFIRDEGVSNMIGCGDFHPDLLKTLEGRHPSHFDRENKFESFLKLTDRQTLLGCLKDSERFLSRNLNLKVYTNMALVFHYCGKHIYIRTAATCYLSKCIDTFLLPMELLRGSRPSCVPLVEKTWHLFMFALWQLLVEENDPYLERLLKDLTLKYLPLFSSKTAVVLKLTTNFDLSQFVFGKIAGEFFEQNKSKQNLFSDEIVFKVLSIVNVILDDLIADGNKMEVLVMFVRVFLLPLFEVYMFKNHKVLAMDMVKKVAALRGRRAELGRLIREGLMAAMLKHMAFGTNQFFQMCYVLVKIVGDVVRELLGRIREEISVLECKRGQGFDNHLRQSYDRLVKMC